MKKILLPLLAVLLLAGSATAQTPSFTDPHPERTRLAEQTFELLMKASSGYDQLNINADRSFYQKELKEHPELYTALYENIIISYCKVDPAIKDEENIKVEALTGKTDYTIRSFPEWEAIGKDYLEKRKQLEE